MIEYLERNGAPRCPADANPAEWMLQVTAMSEDGPDWYDIWRSSPEFREVKEELRLLREQAGGQGPVDGAGQEVLHKEFASSVWTQFRHVFVRTAKHFWRSPVYIWSKLTLTILLVRQQQPFLLECVGGKYEWNH